MNKPIALIVDDDANITLTLEILLQDRGYDVRRVASGREGLEIARRERPAVAFLDLRLPDMDGLAVLAGLREAKEKPAVVMITGHASVESALTATRQGAFDYLVKPFSAAQVEHVLDMIERIGALEREVRELRSAVRGVAREGGFLTRSPRVGKLLDLARQVAETSANVLITGESGTGKGLLAAQIHRMSPFAGGPFVTVDCTALQETLLESELFGHARGAFTGAVRDKVGKLEMAGGGTVFLDEIGELPLSLQAKLLRFLQSREFERVGETKVRNVEVRVIAATNRDLETMVAEGTFRQDLYFRLNVVELRLPPLRERLEDIEPLALAYLESFAVLHRRPARGFTPEALAALTRYSWPGNVRELVNVVERAVVLGPGGMIDLRDLPEQVARPQKSRNGQLVSLDELEKAHLERVLAQASSLEEAARTLGINPATLYRKRKRYGLG